MISLSLTLNPLQRFRSGRKALIREGLVNAFSAYLNDMSYVEDIILSTTMVRNRPMFDEVFSMLFNAHPNKLLSFKAVLHYLIHSMYVEAIYFDAKDVR